MTNRTLSPDFTFWFPTRCSRHVVPLRLAAWLLLGLGTFGPASAQIARSEVDQSHVERASVVVAATDTGARFTAASDVVTEMRLEVFSAAGEKIFDSNFRRGSVLDWSFGGSTTGGQTTPPDDEYLCVITLRDLSGRLRQRRGFTSLRSGTLTLQQKGAGASSLSSAQAQAWAASRRSQLIEEESEDEALTSLGSETASLTVTAHDGKAGQVTTTTGALTFRTGDLFSGKDVERLRITPEGNVGIGTRKPQVKLDVAGMIRARDGIMFSDGSTLKLNERGVLTRTSADGATLSSVTASTTENVGASTQGRIPKFTDNAGTLGDSGITETSAGLVGIGTTSPNAKLTVSANSGIPPTAPLGVVAQFLNPDDTNTFLTADSYGSIFHSDFLFRKARGTMAAPSAVLVDDIIGQIQARGYGATGFSSTSRSGIRLLAGENWTDSAQGAYLSFLTTPNLSATIAERVRITPAGDVGIGTTNPAEKLDVVGNIKASGSVTGATGNVTGNLTVDTNTLHVDAANNRVGVGTTTPGVPLDVAGTINTLTQYNISGNRVLSNAGNANLFVGAGAGAANTGILNSFVGSSAGAANTIGVSNSFFGASAGLGNTTGNNNSYFGKSAGTANTAASNNSFFGASAGSMNTGTNNSFFGTAAGFNNTTAGSNSFFGSNAGNDNTTGPSNSFFGMSAGAANTIGASNSFFGTSVGAANTTGGSNAFVGAFAGLNNTTGNSNSFFGKSAGTANTTADDNSFFGYGAGTANTTGASNSFFGKSAGIANTTADDNSFFGYAAGSTNTTGTNNSFFGTRAGLINSTGDGNSFFGGGAGTTNTTANNNSFFGYGAGNATTSAGDNSFFGYSSGSSNRDGLANSFFGATAGTGNTTGSENSSFGRGAGAVNTSGASNTFVGNNAGLSNTTEDDNTFIGADSTGAAGITNATAIGANSVVTQSNSLVLGNGVKVGIGNSAPSEKLHVIGNVFIGGNPNVGANGLILKSPNGATCAKLTIDNAGALVTTVITCP